METKYIILFASFIILIVSISIFNKLSVKRNQIQNAISSLDALFIKRTDLLPNLITIVKKYVSFEAETLTQITNIRSKNQNQYVNDNDQTKLIKSLLISVENYPELKAEKQFTNLQNSFNECEEQIAAGRRFLSSSITSYNDQVSVFPANIIASIFGFKKHQWNYATVNQQNTINSNELLK